MKTPKLTTERLILRPFSPGDADEVFACWESDPDVARYMFWSSHNDKSKTLRWVKEELEKIDADDWYRWAVVSKESGQLLGTGLIYWEEEYGKFEIAYNLGKKAWGQGYTTEAMREILRFAKNELNITEVVGRHAEENTASRRVLEKLGFRYVRDIPYVCNEGKTTYRGREYLLTL